MPDALTLRVERLCRIIDSVDLHCLGPGRWVCQLHADVTIKAMTGTTPEGAFEAALEQWLADYPEIELAVRHA